MSLSPAQIYLLGLFLVGLRMFWKTRPRSCPCCDEIARSCDVTIDDEVYDMRYLVILIVAILWPIYVGMRVFHLIRPPNLDA